MKKKTFFLASHDFVVSPEPRECKERSGHTARETGQAIYRVSVNPPLPAELFEAGEPAESILLGMISPDWNIGRAGKPGFMVDIYVSRSSGIGSQIDVRDLIKLGMGTVHSTLEEAMEHSPLEQSRSQGSRTEEFSAEQVAFVGEQDGDPEGVLKGCLSRYFVDNRIDCRAYLAKVSYGGSEDWSVALCLFLQSEEPSSLRRDVGAIFAEQFKSDEHLDVMVVTSEQERRLREVCSSFFVSDRDRS